MGVSIPVGYASAAIIFTGSFGTAPYVTTLGLDIGDVGGAFVDAANRVLGTYQDNFADITTENMNISQCVLTIGSDGGSGSVVSSGIGVVGGASAASDAVAMAAVVRKNTATLGRHGRGRGFLPGVLRETDVGFAGTIDLVPKGTIESRYNAWLQDLADTEGPGPIMIPVVLHSEGVEMEPSPILSATCRTKVGWVRGRLH